MGIRSRRLLLPILAALLLAAPAPAAARAVALGGATALRPAAARQASTPAGCPAGVALDAPATLQESAMLCLVNEARARAGLTPLAESAPLLESASEKDTDLIRCNEFSHTACGREFSFWIGQTGYMDQQCWRVGENLAWGVEAEGTVESIFRAWMHSPTHRENLLGAFTETGLELRVGRLGGLSGVHVWVEHFGSHCES